MDPAVFLDRDETLIANDGDLGDPGQVVLLDGVADGLAALRNAGFRLIVVTNQGGVARGSFTESDVDAVHRRIAELCMDETVGTSPIERFYYCPFHPEGTVPEYRREHPWRKPQPGMLVQAAADLNLDLSRSWMIGDQPRDVACGQAAGCRTIRLGGDENDGATATASTFTDAVRIVLDAVDEVEVANEDDEDELLDDGRSGFGDLLRNAAAGGAVTAVVPSAFAEPKPLDAELDTGAATALAELAASPGTNGELERAVRELTDELRMRRLRAAEFTGLRMAAYLGQLVAVMVGTVGLLQLTNGGGGFLNWMAGALLLQLITVAALLADLKG